MILNPNSFKARTAVCHDKIDKNKEKIDIILSIMIELSIIKPLGELTFSSSVLRSTLQIRKRSG